MDNYADAKEALEKIFRQLERINPTAARSLEEGLEETLTVHRLGIGPVLRRKLATTNPIESCFSTVQQVARNVKSLARRRSVAALGGHRIVGSREEIPSHQRLSTNLVAEGTVEPIAHTAEGGAQDSRSRLNTQGDRFTVPNIESRCNQLKLGHPLASWSYSAICYCTVVEPYVAGGGSQP